MSTTFKEAVSHFVFYPCGALSIVQSLQALQMSEVFAAVLKKIFDSYHLVHVTTQLSFKSVLLQ